MQRQHSSQATSTLGNTPNLNIGFLHKGKPYIGSSDRDYYTMLIKLCKNEGNLDVRNMLSDSRKKIIDQNKTRLWHVIKFVEFCDRQERISKKQDGRLVGRIPNFRGEYSQLFFYILRAFLDYSYYKQFFLFKAFASTTSAPPLRKILAAPLLKIPIELYATQTLTKVQYCSVT